MRCVATQCKRVSSSERRRIRYIEERFLDCVFRRFAQKQERGTLRSE